MSSPVSASSSVLSLWEDALETLNKTQSIISPTSLILRRRDRDRHRRLQQQYSLGRPLPDRKLCGNPTCQQSRCSMDTTPKLVLQDREVSGWDKIPVEAIFSQFALVMAERTWTIPFWNEDNRILKMHSVESFIASPPVRIAYLEFKSSCGTHQIDHEGEVQFRDDVAAVTPRLYKIIQDIEKPKVKHAIHKILQPPNAENMDLRPPWTRQDWMMKFLLTIELWRRSDVTYLKRQRWTWESSQIVAELLSAVLFHYWLMDREQCFDIIPVSGSLHLDEIWQAWLDKYALLTEQGEQDDEYDVSTQKRHDFVPRPLGQVTCLRVDTEIGYYGGVGRAATWPLCMKPCLRREG